MTRSPRVFFVPHFLPLITTRVGTRDMASIDDIQSLRSKRRRTASTSARTAVPSRPTIVTTTAKRNDNDCNDSVDSSPKQPQKTGDTLNTRDWSHHLGCGRRLNVIFVGHNPSDVSWNVCAPYAHPSNRFWKLLAETGLVEKRKCEPEYHTELPRLCGVGFIDLFVTDGSDASKVRADAVKNDDWRQDFIERLDRSRAHGTPLVLACVSKVVAKKLLKGWKGGDFGDVGPASNWVEAGLGQYGSMRVWVLPSSSGRAVISWENRSAPFRNLGHFVAHKESIANNKSTTNSD